MTRYGTTPPRSNDSLSRPELSARLETLRAAIDSLWLLTDLQRAMPFECIGRMKNEEMDLEHRLGVYGYAVSSMQDITVSMPPGVNPEHIASRWEQIAVEITKAVLQSRVSA